MPEQETKSKFSKLSKIFSVFLAAFITLGIALIVFFSANIGSFREPIMSELSQVTGLPIEIGSLNLSLSNGLSFHGTGLKVHSKDASHQFFSAQGIYLNVKLKPMLRGQIKIRKIILMKPVIDITLESNQSLINLANTSKELKTLDPKITTKFDDTKKIKSIKIPENKKKLTEPLHNLFQNKNLALRTIELKDALLYFNRPKLDFPNALPTPISLSARFDLDNSIPDQVNIMGDLSHIEIKELSFKGTLKVNNLLAHKVPISINVESSPIHAQTLNNLVDNLFSSELITVKFKSGQIQKLFINLNGIVESSNNPLKEFIVESGFKIDDLDISTSKTKKLESIPFSDVDGIGIWKDGVLNYKINGALWDGSIESNLVFNLPDLLSSGSLTGSYDSVTKFSGLDFSSIRFNDLDKWTPVTGIANGSIKTESSLKEDMRIYGNLEINDISLDHKIPYTAEKIIFNFSQKSPHITLASVQANELQLKNFLIKTVSSKLKVSPEKFLISKGTINSSNGSIIFSGNYNPKPNTYVIRFNSKKLPLSDFFKKQIQGSGNLNGMFQGNLKTIKIAQEKGEEIHFSHLADNLSGKLSFAFINGSISPSLWLMDKLILSPSLTEIAFSEKNMSYDNLIGDFKVWKGKTTINNFKLKGPQINLSASATANLVDGKLYGKIKLMPVQLLNIVKKAAPLLNDVFNNDLERALPRTNFNLDGTLEKPKLTLN